MDHVAAATSSPNWNPLPSLTAELEARLPGGRKKEGQGIVNRSVSPLKLCQASA